MQDSDDHDDDGDLIKLSPISSSTDLSQQDLRTSLSTHNAVVCGLCLGTPLYINEGEDGDPSSVATIPSLILQKQDKIYKAGKLSLSDLENFTTGWELEDVKLFGKNVNDFLVANVSTSNSKSNGGIEENKKGLLISKKKLKNELARLQCLREYMILDAESEPKFERITALASRIFGVDIALISLVDVGRQWFMSNHGLGGVGGVKETARKDAFCHYTVGGDKDLFIVNDATKDPRFSKNPLVTGSPNIRFYAGAPLKAPEGYKLGSLCIIGDVARPNGLSIEEKQNLTELAAMVVEEMVSRRLDRKQLIESKSRYMACTAHDMLTPLTGIGLSLSLAKDSTSFSEIKELIGSSQICCEMIQMIIHRSMSLFKNNDFGRMGHGSGGHHHPSSEGNDDGSCSSSEDEHTTLMPSGDEIPFLKIDLQHLFRTRVSTVIAAYPKLVPVTIHIDQSLPTHIVADEVVLYQSTLNYLTNACKVCDDADRKAGGEIRLEVSGKEGRLVVEVTDCGPGVEIDDYHQLFVPFSHINKSTLNGSGLGLYSVATHIKSIGGKYGYKLRSDGKKGSVFWFALPLTPFDEVEHVDVYDAPGFEALRRFQSFPSFSAGDCGEGVGEDGGDFEVELTESMQLPLNDLNISNLQRLGVGSTGPGSGSGIACSKGKRSNHSKVSNKNKHNKNYSSKCALVIDDSVTVRKPISKVLTKLGFYVDTAENGLKGLEAMKRNTYDLVFCDFLMPVMDGIDCVKQYRKWELTRRPGFVQHIVGISANASAVDAQKGLDVGMSKFIPKPLSMAQIKAESESKETKSCSESRKSIEMDSDGMSTNSANSEKSFSRIKKGCEDCVEVEEVWDGSNYAVKTALVVDDMKSTSKLIAKAIELRGWKCDLAHNGSEALTIMKRQSYTVVFMDNQMPIMNGRDCVSEFRGWERGKGGSAQKNVYLMTASGLVSDEDKLLFDGVIEKPVKLADLHALLDSCCN